ncbi:MAG: M24 family metallopeptidase [Candidatus Binatia bacterium]
MGGEERVSASYPDPHEAFYYKRLNPMDTLHTVLNRGCSIWDQSLVPTEEFQNRLEQIRKGMEERSLELMLVYGDSWKLGNLAYVSHFMPKNRGALALIPRTGDPALVVQEPSRNNPFSRTLTWFGDVVSVGGFMQGLAQVLRARGLQPKRVGLATVEEQLGAKQWGGLIKGLEGVEMVNCGDLIGSLRRTKSSREAALVKRSAEILTDAFSLLRKEMKEHRKEYEIMALAERVARGQGAEDFRFLVARSSQPEIGLRPVSHSEIAKGEGLLVSMAMSYQRYWAELGQTYFLGKPVKDAIESHELAKKVYLKLQEEVKPGTRPESADSWISDCLSSARARDSIRAYGVGNGIGLDLVEEPMLGKEASPEICEGMVLTLRVCLQGKECGSALLASPYRVTSSGVESLGDVATELVAV